jgi:hypothetical protein
MFLQPINAGAPLPGAIFTSLEEGETVNHNLYKDKRDVYLNAGPGPNAPQTAAGLPDGNYYFQVTDPSGKTLLSEDPICCREFRVEDGIIVEFVSKTNGCQYWVGNGKNGYWQDCWEDGWVNGHHDLGINPDHNSLTIQLMPYDDTPNRGGVYKVWVTPVEKYEAKTKTFHGFIPAFSKTDNFKVKYKRPVETPMLKVCKFEDVNGNGLLDASEPPIKNWEIRITDTTTVTNIYFTDDNGCVEVMVPVDGNYIVQEIVQTGWATTATYLNGNPLATPTETVTVTVTARLSKSYSVMFGNFQCFKVDGKKINDLDGDGVKDFGEPGLAGWKIMLFRSTDGGTTWGHYDTTFTDSNGYYSFKVCTGGKFKVVEETPAGWKQTNTNANFVFDAVSGTDQGPFEFLNFQCFTVSGYKYEDMNGDGDWDRGDTGVEGWLVTLYKKVDSVWTFLASIKTDSTGYYSFKVCEGGEYKVVEETKTGWIATSKDYFTFTAESGKSWTFDFFNFKLGKICGYKWYDTDKDGVKDSSENYLSGWTIELWKDGTKIAWTTTDSNGKYCFDNLGPGNYMVKEVMKANPSTYIIWAQTYPSSGDWEFKPLSSGANICNANFGNVKEFTGGLTWGYWKTHSVYGPAAHRDDAYDDMDNYPMDVDVDTPDDVDYEIDTEYDAWWVFQGSDQGNPNASGDGRGLFRVQLLALHMNLIKFTNMASMTYVYSGDSYSGWTVAEIYEKAIDVLTNTPTNYDFHELLNTLDRINNNGHYGPGNHVLVP